MPDPSIPTLLRLSAADIEQAAQRVAVALGLLSLDAPLASLSINQAHSLRGAVRIALAERTWLDTALWCREQFASRVYGRSFNTLPTEVQTVIIMAVDPVVLDAEVYVTGAAEVLVPWTRAASTLGARKE